MSPLRYTNCDRSYPVIYMEGTLGSTADGSEGRLTLTKTRPAWWIEGINAPSALVPWHEIDPWEQAQPEVPDGGVPLSLALEFPVLPGPGSASPTSTPGLDLSGDGLSPLSAPGSGASVQNGSMTAARTPGWAFCMKWSVPPSLGS